MKIVKDYGNNNKILGKEPTLIKSIISFKGKNNVLICEENIIIENSNLSFNGNNSIIYLSKNKNKYYLNVSIYNNSILYMDENNYINGKLNFVLSEGKNIIIGKDCLFSFGIWVRLADPHLIYDVETSNRINFSKSVYIGDHVWVGQDAMILKGTKIGSGSIIGAKSLLSNKKVYSNTIVAGNPAKEIKKNIFFDSRCVHSYTKKETEETIVNTKKDWIYTEDRENLKFDDIESKIEQMNSVDDKISLLNSIRNKENKNRFYI